MAVLPRYQRLGVRAAAPTQLDFANYREMARAGETLSRNVDRISEFLYREQAQRAEYQGRQAVEDLGARPVLQRIDEAGGPTTIQERAAYEVANRVAAAEIQMEADQQITQLIQTAQQAGTPFSQVQSQLSDVVDGYAATLSTLDPQAAGLLRVRLQNGAAQANSRYASWYQRRQSAAAGQRRAAAGSNYANEALELARTDGITPELLQIHLQDRRQTLIDAGASESQADRWFNSAYGASIREHNLYRAATADVSLLESMREMPSEPLPGMSYTETVTEYRAMQSIINDRFASARADLSALNQEVTDYYEILAAGGTIGPEAEANMRTQAEALEGFSPGTTQAVDDLFAQRDLISGAPAMSIGDLQGYISQIEAGLPGRGEGGADTQFETRMLNIARGVAQSMGRAIQDGNVLEWSANAGVMYDGQVVGEQLDFSSPESFSASFSRRQSEVNFLLERNGIRNQRILTGQERSMLQSALTEGDLGVRATALQMVTSSMSGPDAIRIMGELDFEDPQVRQMAHVGVLMSTGHTEAANLALRGMELPSIPALSANNVRRTNADIFGTAFNGMAVAGSNLTQTAITEVGNSIYRAMAQVDPDLAENMSAEDYGRAVNMAMGDYRIEVVNGSQVFLGPQNDAGMIEAIMQNPDALRPRLIDQAQTIDPEVLRRGDWLPMAVPHPNGAGVAYIFGTDSGYGTRYLTTATDRMAVFDLSDITLQELTTQSNVAPGDQVEAPTVAAPGNQANGGFDEQIRFFEDLPSLSGQVQSLSQVLNEAVASDAPSYVINRLSDLLTQAAMQGSRGN